MHMARWMFDISLSERKPSEEVRDRLEIKSIDVVMRQMQMRWFEHIKQMSADNWVSKCKSHMFDGVSGRGRPWKT